MGDIALTRDNVGRIIAKTESIAGASFAYDYAYDDFGRLTEVRLGGAVVEAYTYGPQGERLTETNTRRGILGRTYVYDAEDHLLAAGDLSFSHDLDGFLTSRTDADGTTSYTYSHRGELLRVELPSGEVIEYRHDPLGRRVAKYRNGEVMEKYLWLGRTRLLAVHNADGSLKYRFEYADDRTPVAMTHAGQRFYLAYDQVGSLRAVTDASGAILKAVTYDSFGTVLEDSNPLLDLPFGFAGGLHDADTGLVRFGYRDYAPEVGRWTAKDPIGFKGRDSDLYGYCGNDPVKNVDPDGLDPLILPSGPSGLPLCWKQDFSHQNPEGSRWKNHVGEILDFHKGRAGLPGWRGKDHWHFQKQNEHLEPGSVIDATPCPNNLKRIIENLWQDFNDYMERIIPDDIPPVIPLPYPMPIPILP